MCIAYQGGSSSFVDMMTPEEAARYNQYWSQGTGSYQGIKVNGKWEKVNVDGKNINTRQRMYTTPGTRSITDVKLGNKGEMYYRQTIFDEYGRKIGHNGYTDHGRPDIASHTNPHYHPNPVNNPSQHGEWGTRFASTNTIIGGKNANSKLFICSCL